MLNFEALCIPTPQRRPRVARWGGYKDRKQLENERHLAAGLAPHRPKEPIDGPVVLQFIAFMPIPKSVSKKRRQLMIAGDIQPTGKPDVDNYAKQLMDGLTRMGYWYDDCQCVLLTGSKSYSDNPRWWVKICSWDEYKAENLK